MKLNFYLIGKTEGKERAVYAYVKPLKSDQRRYTVHTGLFLKSENWDSERQESCSKGKHKYFDYQNFNLILNRFRERITRAVTDIIVQNPEATFEQISKALDQEFRSKNSPEAEAETEKRRIFEKAIFDFMKYQEIQHSLSAVKKYKNFFNVIRDFQETERIKLTFDSFNLDLDDRLTRFLITKRKYSNNTVFKFYGFLKTFLNWANSRELTTNQKHSQFKKKQVDTEVIFLTRDELQRLMDHPFTEKYLERVRDVFCFACLTGQRYSDIASIKREAIKGNIWSVFTQKTQNYLQIPLNKEALQILEKYKDQEKPLPMISNQKMNKYLKEALEKAGIDEPVKTVRISGSERTQEFRKKFEVIGTHTARRTFITLSIEAGIPPEAIMKITGHSDYAMMKKYLKITDSFVQKEFKKFGTYLNLSEEEEQNQIIQLNHK